MSPNAGEGGWGLRGLRLSRLEKLCTWSNAPHICNRNLFLLFDFAPDPSEIPDTVFAETFPNFFISVGWALGTVFGFNPPPPPSPGLEFVPEVIKNKPLGKQIYNRGHAHWGKQIYNQSQPYWGNTFTIGAKTTRETDLQSEPSPPGKQIYNRSQVH